jgi:hypothetical protein
MIILFLLCRAGPPGEGEDIPMAKVYHQLINLTNKPPSLRTNEELDELVPWLRKKSSHLFQTLEDRKYTVYHLNIHCLFSKAFFFKMSLE